MRRIGLSLVLVLSVDVATTRGGDGASATLRAALAWQIALDRVGFSPGILDGRAGPKTELATREFQRVRGLPQTGRLDDATATALGVRVDSAVASYVIHADDASDVGAAPLDWVEKSRQSRLRYESLAALIAERFHCSLGLLGRLNPGLELRGLRVGDVVNVPGVVEGASAAAARSLEIDLGEKIIRALDSDGRLLGVFHCSIAKSKDKLPTGNARVMSVTQSPSYTFDPKMWPEVKNVDRKLLIPPGPRNPVGLCWIGLSLPGYGIHGTPHPEMIGKTGSHGCFRLTNWDALRLAKMVRVGAEVKFRGHELVAERLEPARRNSRRPGRAKVGT